jgi:hypothetical protein
MDMFNSLSLQLLGCYVAVYPVTRLYRQTVAGLTFGLRCEIRLGYLMLGSSIKRKPNHGKAVATSKQESTIGILSP